MVCEGHLLLAGTPCGALLLLLLGDRRLLRHRLLGWGLLLRALSRLLLLLGVRLDSGLQLLRGHSLLLLRGNLQGGLLLLGPCSSLLLGRAGRAGLGAWRPHLRLLGRAAWSLGQGQNI